MAQEDHLAYGEYHGEEEGQNGQERGIISDTIGRIGSSSGGPLSSLLSSLRNTVMKLGTEVVSEINDITGHRHTHLNANCTDGFHNSAHRYDSFAAQRDQNDAKWYVDGCGYMWAVSVALEQARSSVWILDWWLSPELYLRRPPSRNENYRLDRMLKAAAERGVKVNVIIYKEVEQALTRKYLSPTLPQYLHSLLPHSIDAVTSTLSKLGIHAALASLEYMEAENPLISAPLTVSSVHTKKALEALHPNISVFRHPDHLPDPEAFQSSFLSSIQSTPLTAANLSKLPGDALKAIYGMNEDVVLYWAHHEKLFLVDGEIAFMGGLDLCYGRWDTNQHSIVDAHPGNLDDIVFPGQDYNNARIMDFQNVAQWKNNKLDRTKSSRMGWSDLSVSLRGQVVEDLRTHFVERWNFIYNEKYDVRGDARYSRLTLQQGYASTSLPSNPQYPVSAQGNGQPGYTPGLYFPPPPKAQSDAPSTGGHHYMRTLEREATSNIKGHLENYGINTGPPAHAQSDGGAGVHCQIVRSCTKWSHGVPTEHSIANAYIDVIHDSSYFLYIENQFFITATSDKQKPVLNQIGAAIVERVVRAARAGQKFKVIILIPAVPGFAGDLKDESSLGTRAIMQYQYNAINRGGHSIMERIAVAGFDPTQYIRFYNLRNYDRLNVSASMREAEQASGINYEQARQEHDLAVDPIGYAAQQGPATSGTAEAHQFQQAAQNLAPRKGLGTSRWDSVAECYMLGGLDIRKVPWEKGNVNEIDAFVSEELYIHTKIMIADDRVVICGSANLNDRSQLGYHDSEIAVVIEDTAHPIDSFMNGRPWKAAKFATTLRRQLFRKHLGLIPPQDMERPDPNFLPVGVPNTYDFGSAEDQLVADPLSDRFLNFWNAQAKTNTVAFSRIFHPVPDDSVRNWKDYNNFYEVFFKKADQEAEGKEGNKMPALYQWGHVVSRNFSPGDQGVREVKDLLSTIRGTLVEMPLQFLIEERDIAKQGLSLNAFTEEIYT